MKDKLKNLSPKKSEPIKQKEKVPIDQSKKYIGTQKGTIKDQEAHSNLPQAKSIEIPQHQE